MELKNAAVIITGAGGGLGGAMARELAAVGCRLLLTDHKPDVIEKLAAELGGKSQTADIAEPDAPQRLLDECVKQFGRADVVLNNAGMMVVGPLASLDLDKVAAMVRLNVEAAFRVALVSARHFLKQKSGFLVNTASVAAGLHFPGAGPYAGTKAALESLSESLRVELAGSGVGVAFVEPGSADTGLFAGQSAASKDALQKGGTLKPEDVARCVRFILETPAHALVPKLTVVPAGQAF